VCRSTCHAYSEVFYVLSGYIDFLQVTGAQEEWITCASAETIIIPTNALHAFYNRTDKPARLLSISTQLHQAFFDAVEEMDRADRLASMPRKQAMARIGGWPGGLICTFLNSHRRHNGEATTTACNQRELQRTIYEDQ
jgi:Cupin domain.